MNPIKPLSFVAILLASLYPGLSGVAAEAVVTPDDMAVLAAVASVCTYPGDGPAMLSDIPAPLPLTAPEAEARMGLPAHIPLRAELDARSHEEGRWPNVDLGACVRVTAGEKATVGSQWIKVSLPGFSADRTQALVYVLFRCGARCGIGQYIALSRTESGWLIAHRYVESFY